MDRIVPVLALLFLSGCGGGAARASARPPELPPPPPATVPRPAPPDTPKPGGPALAFVLLADHGDPDPAKVLAAATAYGVSARISPQSDARGLTLDLDGGGFLIAMRMGVAHPDAAGMPPMATSPDPAAIAASPDHLIVTAMGLPEDPRVRDPVFVRLVAAVIAGCAAVGAMTSDGVAFHRADVFAGVAEALKPGALPVLVTVDVTAARESDTRMSFLTHGLTRYGREEMLVTASIEGKGALGFLLTLVEWLAHDTEKELPTGDTVGRTAEEKILVQRVAHPFTVDTLVVRLDLP